MTTGQAPDPSGAAARAVATLRAVRAPRLYGRRHDLYGARRSRWDGRRYEHLWPFANAWSAIASLAAVPAASEEAVTALRPFLDAALSYRRPAPAGVGFESSVVPTLGPGGDRYFDDNAWLGLAMVRHFEVLGDGRALELARDAFDFTASGWCDDPAMAHPGGVRWRDTPDNRSRHACSTAPAAQLAAVLSLHTGDDGLLEWSAMAYSWTRAALLGPDGGYADRIAPDGTLERTAWSYNQGAMIGAGALLHRATGDPAYLSHARSTADVTRGRYGLDQLVRQGAAFNAIYFRNLALLDDVERRSGAHGPSAPGRPVQAPVGEWATDAAVYADDRWAHARDRRTGLFEDGDSPLNATAPMIGIYALLAGAPAGP